jgi:hypothetical protein
MRAALVVTLWSVLSAAAPLRVELTEAMLDEAQLPARPPVARTHALELVCLSLPGLRALPGYCDGSPAPQRAVAAVAELTIGTQRVRSYAVPGALAPEWRYAALLEPVAGGDARVRLLDEEAGDRVLGEKTLPARTLLAPGTHTLQLGPHALTITVEKPKPRRYAFRVPATRTPAELARSGEGGYLRIPVAEGERVEITAAGRVQPSAKKHPERVAGPDGIPTIATKIQFNQPGFRGCLNCNHAALVGQIGPTPFVIGAHRAFTVDNAGLLLLAINDRKVSDNAGGFEVVVTVTPEGGPRDDDSHVVRNVVDANAADLDRCAAAIGDAQGDLLLSFTVSADGSPICSVEKSAPALAAAGRCICEHARAWRFPPRLHGRTARCPLSFSATP